LVSRQYPYIQNFKMAAALVNPNIVGGLHFLLTKAPERVRLPALNFLNNRLGVEATLRIIKALKYLTIFAVLRKINAKLNDWALNSWTWKSQKENWTWSWEIAVVTGGCSGIGKEIVKQLLEKDVRVAVLDIQALPAELERSKFSSLVQRLNY